MSVSVSYSLSLTRETQPSEEEGEKDADAGLESRVIKNVDMAKELSNDKSKATSGADQSFKHTYIPLSASRTRPWSLTIDPSRLASTKRPSPERDRNSLVREKITATERPKAHPRVDPPDGARLGSHQST